MDCVAIVGAAAWTPQIGTWVFRTLTKPEVSLHLDSKPEIGYTSFGPIFNVRFALLSEKKDVILNKFSVKLRHESGASYTFDWDGISEDLSEIQNPMGPTMSIKKTSLPLIVKVLHTGVAQLFVRFQHKQFKVNFKKYFDPSLAQYNLLKNSGTLKTEEDINNLVLTREFNDVIKILNSEFIWSAGKYTVTFKFDSPNKFSYKEREYTFILNQDDIDILRKNIETIKVDLLEGAKVDTIPDYKRKEIYWEWRHPDLQRKDVIR